MNKIRNQDGVFVFAEGQEGSHIRNKTVYNLTVNKLIDRIEYVWCRGGLDRHCDYSDLDEIMEFDNIPYNIRKGLVRTAYYYFTEKQTKVT